MFVNTNCRPIALGGGGTKISLDGVEIEELKLRTERINVNIPGEWGYRLNGGSAVVYNGEIHILGSGDSPYTQHYKWDGTSWILVSTLPYSFRYGYAIVYNNEIHILGSDVDDTVYTKHYKWDGSSWTSVSTLPYIFTAGSAVVYNNEIHILGGVNSGTEKCHYKWNGTSWSSVSTLPYSFRYGYAIVYNNEIHILSSSHSIGDSKLHYKWNGSEWISVSSSITDNANSGLFVFIYNNKLHYITYVESPGTYSNCLMFHRLENSSWNNIGSIACDYAVNIRCAVVYDNSIHFLYENKQLIIGKKVLSPII